MSFTKNISGKLLPIIILFFSFIIPGVAQNQKVQIGINDSSEININRNCSEIKTIECVGTIDPVNNKSNWMTHLQTFKIEHEVPDPELLNRIKAEKFKLKHSSDFTERGNNEGYRSFVDTPYIGNNFLANLAKQGTPPDNTLAISNGGIIVSAINSNIMYLDTSGNILFEKKFSDFFADTNLTGVLYDPVLYYDSGSDRFIFVLVHGGNSNNSKIVISFSKSNNPMDGWHVYYFSMDSIYTDRWLDYPRIGVSNNELFVAGNIFYDYGGFYTAILFQINKYDGYQGVPLNYITWDNLANNPFTLVPVSYGHQGSYGPGIYIIANRMTSGSEILLYDITNDLDKSPTINSHIVSTIPYSVGPDAYQKGTADILDVGDSRIQYAFYLNSIIHFVNNTDFSPGYTGISYNRLDVSAKTNKTFLIGNDGSTYCYPSLASYTSNGSNMKDVIIGFLASDVNIYPQVRAIVVNDSGDSSSSIIIKNGETYVNLLGGNERWGDYSGIARKHNSGGNPTVWVSGCYGANISGAYYHSFKSWVAELKRDKTNNIEEIDNGIDKNFKLYPNPVSDLLFLDLNLGESKKIEISITDLQGKKIKVLFRGILKEGKSTLSFNKNELNSGIYFIVFKEGNTIVRSEKIVINK